MEQSTHERTVATSSLIRLNFSIKARSGSNTVRYTPNFVILSRSIDDGVKFD